MTKSTNVQLQLLMEALATGANVDVLLRRGFEHHQIIDGLRNAAANGLLVLAETGASITPKGAEFITKMRRSDVATGSSLWIMPYPNATIDPIGELEIYLPNKRRFGR